MFHRDLDKSCNLDKNNLSVIVIYSVNIFSGNVILSDNEKLRPMTKHSERQCGIENQSVQSVSTLIPRIQIKISIYTVYIGAT